MSKIAIISDLHFGASGDSQQRLKFQLDYLEKTFIPYLLDNKITEVIQLGDVFHSRKTINVNTHHWVKKRFFDMLC